MYIGGAVISLFCFGKSEFREKRNSLNPQMLLNVLLNFFTLHFCFSSSFLFNSSSWFSNPSNTAVAHRPVMQSQTWGFTCNYTGNLV